MEPEVLISQACRQYSNAVQRLSHFRISPANLNFRVHVFNGAIPNIVQCNGKSDFLFVCVGGSFVELYYPKLVSFVRHVVFQS